MLYTCNLPSTHLQVPSSVPATATFIPAQTPRPSDLAAAPTPSVPKPDVCPPQHTKSPGSTAVQVRPLMFTPHCIFVDILVVPPIHLLACALWSSRNCHWCCWPNSHTTYCIGAPAAQEDGQGGSADSSDEDEDTRALDSINIPSGPAKLAPVARTTNPGGGGPRQHTKSPGSTAAQVRPQVFTLG